MYKIVQNIHRNMVIFQKLLITQKRILILTISFYHGIAHQKVVY